MGFKYTRIISAEKTFDDEERIKNVYYSELEKIVKKETGAKRVIFMEHTIRRNYVGKEGIHTNAPLHRKCLYGPSSTLSLPVFLQGCTSTNLSKPPSNVCVCIVPQRMQIATSPRARESGLSTFGSRSATSLIVIPSHCLTGEHSLCPHSYPSHSISRIVKGKSAVWIGMRDMSGGI
jgi:hypothetical protein